MNPPPNTTRRRLLGAIAAAPLLGPAMSQAQQAHPATRGIPSSGEALPRVGLGSWITFNVGNDRAARDASAEVMRAFFQAGGRLIDSSPMYGSSQDVIGYGLKKISRPADLFAADKVWISGGAEGRAQMEASRRLWGIPRFDLMQVHNLLSWQAHLPTLFAMKAAGQLRYVGITTSHGRRHGEMAQIMASRPIDFVQLTLQPRRSRSGAAPAAARARTRHRRHRQPAVPAGRAARPAGAPSAAAVGGRNRLHQLGAVRPQVHHFASGRHLRDSRHHARRPRAGEPRCGKRAAARPGAARAHGRLRGAALMSEWWSYGLRDLLLFSPRTYYRLFELYNLE